LLHEATLLLTTLRVNHTIIVNLINLLTYFRIELYLFDVINNI